MSLKEGPSYGYFPQPEKCILIAKEGKDYQLQEAFRDTQLKITTIGARHLGSVLGSLAFKRVYFTEKVEGWIEALKTLAKFAQTQPHAAFAVFTHCLQGCWTFLCRTVPVAGFFLEALEDCIRRVFIPALLKRDVSDNERNLLSLPAKIGGLGIFNPAERALSSFSYSEALCFPLISLVLRQADFFDPSELRQDQNNIRALQDLDIDYNYDLRLKELTPKLPPETQKGVELARQQGASSWVTAMTNEEHGTILHKGDFLDAIYMRYGWPILSLPLQCACGAPFSVQHSLDCKLGGYRTLQHNEVRDLFAQCLREAKFHAVDRAHSSDSFRRIIQIQISEQRR